MAGRNYEKRQKGECQIVGADGQFEASYYIGIVTTGRARVWSGHYVRVLLWDDIDCTGEDAGSLRGALWRLARNLTARNLVLRCAGLSADFSESGLSQDSGFGYIGPRHQPIHMMTPTPLEFEGMDCTAIVDGDVDQLIREAVDGMKFGQRD